MAKWKESMSVGVKKFDDQHQRLLDLIDDFYENIRTRSNEENLELLIKEMKEYTVYHFKDEEAALLKHNYPKYDQQKAEHDSFVKKVEVLEERFKSGKLKLSFEVTSFLKKWVVDHIQGSDKEYADFLSNRDVD